VFPPLFTFPSIASSLHPHKKEISATQIVKFQQHK
jgi:hypothetical protein